MAVPGRGSIQLEYIAPDYGHVNSRLWYETFPISPGRLTRDFRVCLLL